MSRILNQNVSPVSRAIIAPELVAHGTRKMSTEEARRAPSPRRACAKRAMAIAARLSRRDQPATVEVRPRRVGHVAERHEQHVVADERRQASAGESTQVVEADHVARRHARTRRAAQVASEVIQVEGLHDAGAQLVTRERLLARGCLY